MTRIRPKTALAAPSELGAIIRETVADLEAIAPMYARLHSLGLEAGRSDSVHVSGGGQADQTGQLAVDSDRARQRRDYARWVVREVLRASKVIDRLRQGLEHNVGPSPGYRQSESLGSDAFVTLDQFTESQRKQKERLKAGTE